MRVLSWLAGAVLAIGGASASAQGYLMLPNVPYATRSGGNQTFDLYYPANYASVSANPLYIHFHESGGDKTGHAAIFQQLASSGFVVVSANYREYIAPNNYEVAYDDARMLTSFILSHMSSNEHPRIDNSRISVGGFSLGGHIAAVEATASQTFEVPGGAGKAPSLPVLRPLAKYKCLVNAAGPWDLGYTLSQTGPEYNWVKGFITSRFGVSPPAYLSPGSTSNIRNLAAASVLIAHSPQDTAVPIGSVSIMAPSTTTGRIKTALPNVAVKVRYTNVSSYLLPGWSARTDHYLATISADNPFVIGAGMRDAFYSDFVALMNSSCK